ncbi:bZIP transcription factor 11-like [Canna indica]|uniref:BZIP transcription factor 11-like n=1 Tax=Canna indica TaxID=4628 RepID=A0AAQ3L3G4_9LILI|nr:bZIP transcription factor 11-like [Canna indica]
MASPGGASSGSTQPRNSASEDLQAVMDQKKRRRMISNRESARRSRLRKQKHLDDLMAQVTQLMGEKERLLATVSLTNQECAAVEAENSVLRAQAMELSHRLQSLSEILSFLSNFSNGDGNTSFPNSNSNSWNFTCNMSQPILASAESVFYY